MRLKSFVAHNLKTAMLEVRDTLGDDAIIVDTKDLSDGSVQITAALDDTKADEEIARTAHQDPIRESSNNDLLKVALDYHGVPLKISDRLLYLARQAPPDPDTHGLTHAIDSVFQFTTFPVKPRHPLILIGQTASGKTVTAAKLATRSVINGHRVHMFTTDTVRAGAVAQLSAFTRLLKQPLKTVESPSALKNIINQTQGDDVILVDTFGINPFSKKDMQVLKDWMRIHTVEPVVVLPAGGDAMEAAEIASLFAKFRPHHLLVTRLDTARRLGSLLAAAFAGNLSFSLISLTPFITNGLIPLNAAGLARLLLRDPTQSEISAELQKAMP